MQPPIAKVVPEGAQQPNPRLPKRWGDPPQPAHRLHRPVARIAAKELVSSDPGEGDCHLLPGLPRKQPCQIEGRVPEGLIEILDEVEHLLRMGEVDGDFVVIRSKAGGDSPRFVPLIVVVEARFIEAHREGADWRRRLLCHQPDEDVRIDSPRQKGPDWYVPHPLSIDRRAERLANLPLPLGRAPLVIDRLFLPTPRIPVALDSHYLAPTDVVLQRMAGEQLLDPREHRPRRRYVEVGEEVVDRLPVDLCPIGP